MIHGKAKQMFEEWYFNKYQNSKITMGFKNFPLVCQQALIVEFLDSQNIYVSISKMELLNGFSYSVMDKLKGFGGKEKTRPEATQKAIEKSILILNSRL